MGTNKKAPSELISASETERCPQSKIQNPKWHDTYAILLEVQPIYSSQYAEARSNCADLQTKPIKIIPMFRHTFPTTAHWLKSSKYLSVIMLICATWNLTAAKCPAQAVRIDLSGTRYPQEKAISPLAGLVSAPVNIPQSQILAQNLASTSTDIEISKDFRLQDVTITQDSADKSLLTVKGFINNRSERAHYVYYIVAKFIANDTAIKQTVIPVNIDLEPGQSKPFVHEVSTDNVKSIVPATVRPLIVKYEYR